MNPLRHPYSLLANFRPLHPARIVPHFHLQVPIVSHTRITRLTTVVRATGYYIRGTTSRYLYVIGIQVAVYGDFENRIDHRRTKDVCWCWFNLYSICYQDRCTPPSQLHSVSVLISSLLEHRSKTPLFGVRVFSRVPC